MALSCDMWELVPCPRIEPGPLALGASRLSQWTTREVTVPFFKINFYWSTVALQ